MKKEQLYLTISTAIIVILVISTAMVLNQKNQEIKELESLTDELSTQNFLLKTEVGRYEISVDIFKERNLSGAKQFDEILNRETE